MTGLNNWFLNGHYPSNTWIPARLDNLAAWFDASDTSTITLNGSNVSQWDDKSDYDNHATQATASDQPEYKVIDKTIHFTEDYINLPDVVAQCGFFVVKNANNGVDPDATHLISNNISTTSTSYVFLSYNYSYTASIDGLARNTGDIKVNGSNLTPGDGTGTNISISDYTPFPDHNEFDLFYFQLDQPETFKALCAFFSGYLKRSNIDIAEIVLYNSNITTGNIEQNEGYLAHKWGFTDKLPTGHPYKEVAP